MRRNPTSLGNETRRVSSNRIAESIIDQKIGNCRIDKRMGAKVGKYVIYCCLYKYGNGANYRVSLHEAQVMEEIFDWNRLMMNDLPYTFLLEVLFRTVVMFISLIIVLIASGKRGVKQLSIFETVIIIALGSAAGDPMFYEDVGVLPAIVVLITIILLYRFLTWLIGKSRRFENLLEGKCVIVIEDGIFALENFNREPLAEDEFFSELRVKGVEHLGQIKSAILETSGELSVYFYEDKMVKAGLPIHPTLFGKRSKIVADKGNYSCVKCGAVLLLTPGKHNCKVCGKKEWVKAIDSLRVK